MKNVGDIFGVIKDINTNYKEDDIKALKKAGFKKDAVKISNLIDEFGINITDFLDNYVPALNDLNFESTQWLILNVASRFINQSFPDDIEINVLDDYFSYDENLSYFLKNYKTLDNLDDLRKMIKDKVELNEYLTQKMLDAFCNRILKYLRAGSHSPL